MSELTTDNVSYKTEDTSRVDFVTDSNSDSDSEIQYRPQIKYTIDDVPQEIENIRLIGLLYIEILKSGDMMSTGNDIQDQANTMKIKNHVAYWAYSHPADCTTECSTVRFSMDVVNPDASFGVIIRSFVKEKDLCYIAG